jgi:adenylate cyclase
MEQKPGVDGPDSADRLRLRQLLTAQGATAEELSAATAAGTLGGLALELKLRGRVVPLTFADAAGQAGLAPAEAAGVWSALGFPAPDGGTPDLTPDEVAALRLLADAGHDLLGREATLGLVRVIGSSAAHLAQALVDAFRVSFEMPRRTSGVGYSEIVTEYSDLVEEQLPAFLDAFGAVFMRHLVAVASSNWLFDPETTSAGRDLTVGFVDLAGYTALSRTLTARELARLVTGFETVLGDVLSRRGGQLVKLLGDGAMFVVPDPVAAGRVALELADRLDREPDVPAARVGLAAGRVVSLHGDYFGDVVNLASRLVALAEPSTVVASEEVRRLAGDQLRFAPLPPSQLKGFDVPTTAYRLRAD